MASMTTDHDGERSLDNRCALLPVYTVSDTIAQVSSNDRNLNAQNKRARVTSASGATSVWKFLGVNMAEPRER